MIFSLFNVTFSLQCEPGTEYVAIITEMSDWYKTSYISHKYCRSLYWALKIPHLHKDKLRAYSKALFSMIFHNYFSYKKGLKIIRAKYISRCPGSVTQFKGEKKLFWSYCQWLSTAVTVYLFWKQEKYHCLASYCL